jgi:hypothetical protein
MAANANPIFALTPNVGFASVAAANTASDGSGALTTLFTSPAGSGSRIERIRYANAQAVAAASSGMVIRFFITDNAGNNPRLLAEVALATATRSTTAIGAQGILQFPGGLVVPAGTLLKVCQSVYAGVQDLMHYVCEGADFS